MRSKAVSLKRKEIAACIVAIFVSGWISYPEVAGSPGPFDWRSDWAIKEGFSIQIDSSGYEFPTSLVFVPEPGSKPKDPLYFVLELRGKVKVVTNDRSVITFAENFFRLPSEKRLPRPDAEVGSAGICLHPDTGSIFVTFVYRDDRGILRNNVARFQSEPKVFSVKPTSLLRFTEVFSSDTSAPSHQIGPCQVKSGHLYVSVGDGFQTILSQKLESTLGKILRMTLDGKPVSDNPFYQNTDVKNARNYVWAYGLRNPFGLRIVGEQVFVADNGPAVDRFLEVRKGVNYLWNGTDWSIATNADFVFVPSFAPVQLDYYSGVSSIFPGKYDHTFFVALASSSKPKVTERPGIVALQYGFNAGRMLSVPDYFVRYRGRAIQSVVGLAFGRDGLYFAPLYPNQEGTSAILKVVHNPAVGHPFIIGRDEDAETLMLASGCLGCHRRPIPGEATWPPPLDRATLADRLQKRLNSDQYVESLKQLDRVDARPEPAYKEGRRQVLAARGRERVRVWLRYQITQPGFDNPFSQMPNLGVSDVQALIISRFLLEEDKTESDRLIARGKRFLERLSPGGPRYRHVVFAFFAGLIVPFLVFGLRRPRRTGRLPSTRS